MTLSPAPGKNHSYQAAVLVVFGLQSRSTSDSEQKNNYSITAVHYFAIIRYTHVYTLYAIDRHAYSQLIHVVYIVASYKRIQNVLYVCGAVHVCTFETQVKSIASSEWLGLFRNDKDA